MSKKKDVARSQTEQAKTSQNSKNQALISNSKHLVSEDVIKKHFAETGDLTTIQKTDTIIYPPSDAQMGATQFRNLMAHLFGNRPAGRKPVLIWLANDLTQLYHVIKSTERDDEDLYKQLAASAIYAEANLTTPLYKALAQTPVKATGKHFQTLTVHPQEGSSATDFMVYGHCRPSDEGTDWQDEPHCERLTKISDLVAATVTDLHLAHDWIIGGKKNTRTEAAIKKLEDSEIFVRSIDKIIT